MARHPRSLAALIGLWVGLAPWSSGASESDPGGGPAAPAQEATAPSEAPDLAAAAERWRRLDPERRAELERRFERFRALDEDQRALLRDRARRLREERAELAEGLPASERDRLSGLPPEVRDQVLRRQQVELARRRGERLREVLPPPFLHDLEQAPPVERPRVLRDLRRELRARHLPGLGLSGRGPWERSPSERDLSERRASGRDRSGPGRARSERGRFARGGLSPEELERLGELPFGERVEALRALAHARHRSVLPAAVTEDLDLRERLGRAAMPTVDELLESGDRPDPSVLRVRARERVLALLRESGRLDADELGELERLPAGKLLRGLRPSPPRPAPGPLGPAPFEGLRRR